MSGKPDLAALFGAPDVDTFFGLARAEPGDGGASAALIGVPGATPYAGVGAYCAGAPAALRRASGALAANMDRHNFDLGGPVFPEGSLPAVDCGDLPFDPADFAANRKVIAEAVRKVLATGAVPVVVGGDDSVPIPILAALETTGRPVWILQIDAHIDWRREHMGEDMGLSSTMRRASEMAHVAGIVQVGARGIGSAHPDDVADALDWGARIVTAEALHADGTAPVLEAIPEGADIALCLDVDAFDPALVPGVIGRAPGGLSYGQGLALIRGAAARGRIVAADVVEYVPEADVDGIGALTVTRAMAALLGVLSRQGLRAR